METSVDRIEQITRAIKKETLTQPSAFKLEVGSVLDVGMLRTNQEDSIFVPEDAVKTPLFAVADGMGGEEAGEVASSIAVSQIERYEKGFLTDVQGTPLRLNRSLANTEILATLIRVANAKIYNLPASQEARKQGAIIGTTEVAVAVNSKDRLATFAWAGDSLGYVYTPDARYPYRYYETQGIRRPLSQVTRPHSLVEIHRSMGQIVTMQLEQHPDSSTIYRPIGDKPTIEVDTTDVPIKNGDVLVLCSDGLLAGGISHRRIEQLMARVSKGTITPQEAAEELTREAKLSTVQILAEVANGKLTPPEAAAILPTRASEEEDRIVIEARAGEVRTVIDNVARGAITPQEAETELTNKVIKNPGPDNISIIVVKIEEEAKEELQLREAQKNYELASRLYNDLSFALDTGNTALIKEYLQAQNRNPEEIEAVARRIQTAEVLDSLLEGARLELTMADLQVRAAELPNLLERLEFSTMLERNVPEMDQMILTHSARVEGLSRMATVGQDVADELNRAKNTLEQWVIAKSIREDRVALQRMINHITANAVNYRELDFLTRQYKPVLDIMRASYEPSDKQNFVGRVEKTKHNLYGNPEQIPDTTSAILKETQARIAGYLEGNYYDVYGETKIPKARHAAETLFPVFLNRYKDRLGLTDLSPAEIRLLAPTVDLGKTNIIHRWIPQQLLIDHIYGLEGSLQGKISTEKMTNIAAARVEAERIMLDETEPKVNWKVLQQRINEARKSVVAKKITGAKKRLSDLLSFLR